MIASFFKYSEKKRECWQPSSTSYSTSKQQNHISMEGMLGLFWSLSLKIQWLTVFEYSF